MKASTFYQKTNVMLLSRMLAAGRWTTLWQRQKHCFFLARKSWDGVGGNGSGWKCSSAV